MGGSLWIVLILQLLGLVVILAEFFIPSMGILTVAAVALVGYSLYTAFTTLSPVTATVILIADIVMAPLVIMAGLRLLGRTSITLRSSLDSAKGVSAQSQHLDTLTGCKGVATTDLRPSGIARINERRVDVVCTGGYVEAGTPVEVTGVEGNQVLVKAVEAGSGVDEG